MMGRHAVRHDRDAIVRAFELRTGWRPDAVRIVGGALRYTRYGWLKKRRMRRIAAKAGGDTDTTRDYEYTDWKALHVFAQQFAWRHGFARVPLPAWVAPEPAGTVPGPVATALAGTTH
jgi:menaquinone-dependent protoporphyrinogen IX oxidase